MPTCDECKSFFEWEDDPMRGDCVIRCKDIKSEYWLTQPTEAMRDALECPRFIARDDPTKQVADLGDADRPICERLDLIWKEAQEGRKFLEDYDYIAPIV